MSFFDELFDALGAVPAVGAGVTVGVFDCAPGMPAFAAPEPLVFVDSPVTWLRIATLSAAFGLNVSAVCSLWLKSMSAVTSALTLPAPTIGSRIAAMRC